MITTGCAGKKLQSRNYCPLTVLILVASVLELPCKLICIYT